MGVMTARSDWDQDDILIRNLSLNGACISASRRREADARMTFLFRLPAGRADIKVAGSVVWSTGLYARGYPRRDRMGIRFTVILPDDRKALEQFIEARLEFGEADQEDKTDPDIPSLLNDRSG
jgi:hypothetical protein